MRIKRSLQRGPKYPKKGKNPRPKAKHRRTSKRSGATKPGSHHSGHHGQPVVAATVRPWWSHFPRLCGFPFACLFDFRRFLLCFLFILPYIWTYRNPIHSIAIIFSIRDSFRVVFRERKRERRRTARILHRAWRSKDGSTHLDELFFFSTLFSI